VNADVGAGHRRSACPTHAATATKVQWPTPTLASILTHAVTEAGKLSQGFDVVCLGGVASREQVRLRRLSLAQACIVCAARTASLEWFEAEAECLRDADG
jgi:hypothetical protein